MAGSGATATGINAFGWWIVTAKASPLARDVTFQFVFANDFTTLAAQSTKSVATGLIIRFFSVTIPMGPTRLHCAGQQH
jgi:hypothetical protein